jgi:hypothetical protein
LQGLTCRYRVSKWAWVVEEGAFRHGQGWSGSGRGKEEVRREAKG